jgi:hypothetical protein
MRLGILWGDIHEEARSWLSPPQTDTDVPGESAPKLPAPPTFGSTVQFTILASFDTGPAWALKYFKGPSGSSKGIVNDGLTTTDSLILALSPGKPVSDKVKKAKAKFDVAETAYEFAQTQYPISKLSAQWSSVENARNDYINAVRAESDPAAAVQAQAFTTNIILQNLAGSIPQQ